MPPGSREPDPVVVTSFGVISALGVGVEDFAAAMYDGRSAHGPSERFGDGVTTAEIRGFDPKPWLGASGLRVLDRTSRLLCVAAHLALRNSGIDVDGNTEGPEVGLVCGTMLGSAHSIVSFDFSGLTGGPEYVSPLEFPNTVISSPAGQTAIRFHLRGINSTICAGFASGLMAIGYGAEFVRNRRVRVLLAGGAEELCEESLLGLRQATAPASDGLQFNCAIPGEGAALFLMEQESCARLRGMKPLVEIAGFAAMHAELNGSGLQPATEAAQDAIGCAFDEAHITPDRIAGIIAGQDGSRTGAEIERRALEGVFGKEAASIPACAPKAALGEALGTSGALAAVIGALALQRNCMPPTVGSDRRQPGLSPSPQPIEGDYVLVHSFGCDGNYAALVLKRTV